MVPWTEPLWLAEAHEWIHEQLARLGVGGVGVIDQHHVRPWSTVMRVPTEQGDVYFKANTPALRHEAALVEILAARRPDCVPPLLAVDVERGWMLMADAGTRLREYVEREQDLTCWLEILPLYAGVQIDLADQVDQMVAFGVPDLRLSTLPSRYEELLDSVVDLPSDDRRRLEGNMPRVREMCEELAGYGLPETIQHDDFHDGQVFVRDGRYLLLDWGDACVSHPFFTLSVTLEGGLAWGLDDVQGSVEVGPFRDAYLAPFTRIAKSADLEPASEIAMRLGWVCRAVNGHLAGEETADTQARLRMFLDGRP
ncbi:MAG TPA: phosphotransferase [Gaiellaceae bacterium]|nr:phosphotransferase [Gaiellaceae bacterium]